MKKIIIPFAILLILLMACSNGSADTDKSKDDNNDTDTITYESEEGPIEVPADPQRVVVVSSYAGDLMALGVNIVGVDAWSKMNPQWEEDLADVEEVSDESLEKIIELEPDLIIGFTDINNVDKLKEIAPTVLFTYGAVDYLTQHLEIGKLVNKEEEAQAWIDDFKQRAQETGEEIQAKTGEDATVSVIENFDKQLYVYGDNFGRGTEVLYQAMGMKMPKKVAESAQDAGYYAMSLEVLPEYAGDYIILSRYDEADNAFMESDIYQNIPAVANNHVFEVNGHEFYNNDPLTLDYQLAFFKEAFLN